LERTKNPNQRRIGEQEAKGGKVPHSILGNTSQGTAGKRGEKKTKALKAR